MDISKDGKYLAVGSKLGDVFLFDPLNLKPIGKSLKLPHEVSIVKFSPNSEYLAVGVAPPSSIVTVFSVSKGFKEQSKMKGNPSRVIHIDFAENSIVIYISLLF